MRRIAAELSHETAFAHRLPDSASADWALRWFTPAAESNVCGHATLATAHVLHTDRATPLTVRFASQFGILIARTRHDGTITLDFPAAFPAEVPAARRGTSLCAVRRPARQSQRPGDAGTSALHVRRSGW
jgi:PhzF family phenazine biosynthesis protein